MPEPAPLSTPITWTSDDPHLSGNFAPIGTEIDARDLPVIAGCIPDGLKGAYMRNGPNMAESDFSSVKYVANPPIFIG